METLEPYLIAAGQLACLVSAVYLLALKHYREALFIFFGLLLMFQWGYVAQNIATEEMGSCWAQVASYYECLPIQLKLSAHLSQVGYFLLAVGIVLIGRKASVRK